MQFKRITVLGGIVLVSLGAYAVQQTTKPPVMMHDAAGREQCAMCHGSEMDGIPQSPATHEEFTTEICGWCHSADAEMQTATPKPTSHDVVGREQCGMCHASGMADIPQNPVSHEGRDVKWCTACHVKM